MLGRIILAGKSAAAVPTLSSLSYTQGDTDGGGQAIVGTGTNLSGATNVLIGGINVTPSSSTSTTVTFTLPAHGAGTVTDVVVTTAGGTSTPGLSFEYWIPTQITGVDGVWDANKSVVGGAAVSSWTDQTANAIAATQSTGANKPAQTSSVFGTLPSIRFTPQQWLSFTSRSGFTTGITQYFVGKWTGTTTTSSNPTITPAYCAIGNDGGGVQNQFGAAGGAAEYHYSTTGWQTITRGSGFNDGVPRLIGVTHDTSGNVIIYNGTTQQGSTATGITYDTTFTNYQALGVGYTDVDGWSGDIGAIIVVKAVISGTDQTKLNAWARQRFGT